MSQVLQRATTTPPVLFSASLSASAQTNPDAGACDFYVARKKRFCRSEKRAGSRFCHTHHMSASSPDPKSEDPATSTVDAGPPTPQRVPCPLNPNHTVYASRLQHHMKVCPDLRFVPHNLPYFSENMHAFRGRNYCAEERAALERKTHHSLDAADLDRLIARVRECYFSCIQPHIVFLAGDEYDATGRNIDQTRRQSAKHGPQHRGLLRCVEKAINGFFEERQNQDAVTAPLAGFLELGAGKGGLSLALQEAILSGRISCSSPMERVKETLNGDNNNPPPRIIVVDVSNFRRKGDACVRYSSIPLTRLRVNIKDLDLATALRMSRVHKHSRSDVDSGTTTKTLQKIHLPSVTPNRWVAVGKHLCGACTDFSLSCVTDPSLHKENHASVVAVVLATCCHQRCELRHLNGLQHADGCLQTELLLPGTSYGVTADEFAAIASMSSWAVSGDVMDDDRKLTGICCKRVIDALRLLYLKQQGYRSAYLCEYVSPSITAENLCLVAFR